MLRFSGSRGEDFQFAEIDRRPRLPRQLAGENGSSGYWEASFDAAELPGEGLFNSDTDSFRPGVARDDAADAGRAADDVAFKPNCLGIQASIQSTPCGRRV
ncbi:hypothetical protein [Bradyrhizobium sp. AZCC 1693]|uniref:hypothetical protein n=1 Tax=Bradyrhizobium sp. AZCC 1693 TaxID=3117029 RepID=UPI002FEFAB87